MYRLESKHMGSNFLGQVNELLPASVASFLKQGW